MKEVTANHVLSVGRAVESFDQQAKAITKPVQEGGGALTQDESEEVEELYRTRDRLAELGIWLMRVGVYV